MDAGDQLTYKVVLQKLHSCNVLATSLPDYLHN